MEIKQNPFSFYDFLGYFVPGGLFLFALVALAIHANPAMAQSAVAGLSISPDRAEFYLPFILASYLVGHALSFVSSVSIERFSVWRLGYPSGFLLQAGYPGFFDVQPPRNTRIAVRLIVTFLIAPISLLDLTLGTLLRLRELYARPLDDVAVAILPSRIAGFLRAQGAHEATPLQVRSGRIEWFRLVYHFCVENTKSHLPKMQNYVALYGFCRTISFGFVAFFWIAVAALGTRSIGFEVGAVLSALAGFLAYVFYLDFLKFYRRFSQEVLMAFPVLLPEKLGDA